MGLEQDERRGIGSVETRFHTFAHQDTLALRSGEALGPITLSYETHGQLNAERDNAILVFHALSGSHHLPRAPKNLFSHDAPHRVVWPVQCKIASDEPERCYVQRSGDILGSAIPVVSQIER
mgnify:CR=1 FL=1